MKDYWLRRNFSILHGQAVLRVSELARHGKLKVRTASSRRPVHAKIYASDEAVILGSSNFTPPGLAHQTEGNVRFTRADSKRLQEARNLAEGIWLHGAEYPGFVELLESLLKHVTWQEALARACAVVLEGEWAKEYVPPELLSDLDPPLWPHQLEGISQAMWVLENVGSVLVADATGSGKTQMGAWIIRAAFDRQYASAGIRKPLPLIIAPPGVVPEWHKALAQTYLPFTAHSHGLLSAETAEGHAQLSKSLSATELLAVDEAHNYLNRKSQRTIRVSSHYAENAILFTATPINRSAGDLVAMIELLGADNLPNETIEAVTDLRSRARRGAVIREDDLENIRKEIRRFTVRRTRRQLNEIAARNAESYRLKSGRSARYPAHRAQYYDCGCRDSDVEKAREIVKLASQLKGVTRLTKRLRVPEGLEMSEDVWVRQMLASAHALAEFDVLDALRSSRAALFEHVYGTASALSEIVSEARGAAKKNPTGNLVGKLERHAGKIPDWELPTLEKTVVARWLWDEGEHRSACEEDARIYREIGHLAKAMSSDREEKKAALLARLAREGAVVLAFDRRVISLMVMRRLLSDLGIASELLTGDGGKRAKARAKRQYGQGTKLSSFVALCSNAFSEGMNLQGASCVVHLDTPTVIRLAEQRAGRIDRMNSSWDTVHVWWPRDPEPFAPRRGEVLVRRHATVAELIGANLQLPGDKDAPVVIEQLAEAANLSKASDASDLYDAFKPVRSLVGDGGLVAQSTYDAIKDVQASIVSRVSAVWSEEPWAFMVVGGPQRRAPRWVFFDSLDGEIVVDFARIEIELRKRLAGRVEDLKPTPETEQVKNEFVELLRSMEEELLPIRRRRALGLLAEALKEWSWQASRRGEPDVAEQFEQLRRRMHPEPADLLESHIDRWALSDAWLKLIRPRIRRALSKRRTRKGPWRIEHLLPDLGEDPFDAKTIASMFDRVPEIEPIDRRIVAMIVGVRAI